MNKWIDICIANRQVLGHRAKGIKKNFVKENIILGSANLQWQGEEQGEDWEQDEEQCSSI